MGSNHEKIEVEKISYQAQQNILTNLLRTKTDRQAFLRLAGEQFILMC